MTPTNESGPGEKDDYAPFEHVPDRIDQITASGLEQLHDELNDQNKAKLRSVPVEQQAGVLWRLVEKGTISLYIAGGQEGNR